jgi:hypothetical protein
MVVDETHRDVEIPTDENDQQRDKRAQADEDHFGGSGAATGAVAGGVTVTLFVGTVTVVTCEPMISHPLAETRTLTSGEPAAMVPPP